MTNLFRLLLATALAVAACPALADSWMPPTAKVTESADHRHRVTVVPRELESALAFFDDKVKGTEPAGQRAGDPQRSPVARVEARDASGQWHLLWQMPLVNDVAPVSVLLAKDAKFLVTFDNWHSMGYGDDVVAIYDHQGHLVRKLGLEDILPEAYVNHLPRSVSSRWWGRDHALVDEDRAVELQVLEPGSDIGGKTKTVPVRLRLADGALIPPSGAAWEKALARALQLEATRQAAWDKVRQERISPLSAPATNDTHAWRHYLFEIRDRIAGDRELIGGMVLAAPGEDKGWHDADAIRSTIESYDAASEFSDKHWIFTSPTSDALANVLAKALRAREAGSLKDLRIVFIGKPADGQMLIEAAQNTGATITVVDSTTPFPPGKPLPERTAPGWVDTSADF
ncbi:MAG: hypothetical protein E6Q50_16540 [Lysobacter sp.]|nr:MAG: hypothetical protein E6Q50_16540 [Lysobacter sp.]